MADNAQFDEYAPPGVWVEPIQVETPPPTPPKPTTARDGTSESTEVLYWGYLQPVSIYCENRNWFFLRKQRTYTLGASLDMDCWVYGSSISADHHCTFIWDGTDSASAVRVVDYADQHWGPWGGTFINDVRLLPGVPALLRHGDRISFVGEEPMASNEDLRYTWCQCTLQGWRSGPKATNKLRNTK